MQDFNGLVSFIWQVADLIRDTFKRGKYQDVILPFTVLRRIDCVLEPTKRQVLEAHASLKGKLDNLEAPLRNASGYAFFNTSRYDFKRLVEDPGSGLADNLLNYINGFSDNMKEVLEKFDFRNTIQKLDDAGLLYLVLQKFHGADLHPDAVSNQTMGYIFEELLRKFNEALDENPGEHFTPPEVIKLMVELVVAPDAETIRQKAIIRTVYDPCCGTGGMLTGAKERILSINDSATVYLFGQEVNPETYAICKADILMKSADGTDADNIRFGSTLRNDLLPGQSFDYILANPPYGKEWKNDRDAVLLEADKGERGRFFAGLPRISDGQLLFLEHMLSKMHGFGTGRVTEGSRVAIVMNGSPLFTGDAGSGESEIRRYILEHDWLEAIVALPEQLFYNTGIATYIWILSDRKEERRRGLVQLIDAGSFWTPMRKSLGDKRRQITEEGIMRIRAIFERFREEEHSKIFPTTHFGYRKITIDRPLRLNLRTSPERIERLKGETAFAALGRAKKGKAGERTLWDEGDLNGDQREILAVLEALPGELYTSRNVFEKDLDTAAKSRGVKLSAQIRKAILTALAERDETAEIVTDRDGLYEPDPELRDTENVPLTESIDDYVEREVIPHVPDAWINDDVRDAKDGEIGRVGYEINFNRYFYTYTPPRPLAEIERDIRAIEKEILEMLGGVLR